ncbi:GNAT family N-acetyltransferase [Naumannella halotolerans]|uniref:GNAT family N-acetyltransferase n=1 Tax=Naumannella halotolerans TaxID=993414 RepID=UPI00370D37DC
MEDLRPVRDTDSAALIELIGGIWSEYPGIILDVDAEEPWMRSPATAWAEHAGDLWVLERDGVLVASVGWRPAAGAAELKSLYVAAQARGSGLGAALVRAAETAAADAGCRELILWTDTRFTDAHRLYERLGFSRRSDVRELNDLSQTKEYLYVKPLQAPIAEKRPITRTHHGETFVDDYEWLRDRDDPQVLAHLHAENDYAAAVTAGQAKLRQSIFDEIKARTQETDLSVPRRRGDWWYYGRMVEGEQYGLHCRVPAGGQDWTPPVIDPNDPPAQEQILLDENAEADGHAFYSLGAATVSDDGNLLAYAVDHAGNEKFTLKVRDLRTGDELADEIPNTFYGPVWAPDASAIFYLVVDDSWRPYQVRRHLLGTAAEADQVIWTEDDTTMWTGIDRSADHRTLIIGIGNSEVSENQLLDLTDPAAEPQVVLGRDAGVLYSVEPVDIDSQRWLIITHDSDGARNSMVSILAAEEISLPRAEQVWRTVVPHDDRVRITSAAPAAGQLFVGLRRDTVPTIGYVPLTEITAGEVTLQTPEFETELHSVELIAADLQAPLVRLVYETYLTPARVYDFVPDSAELLLRKENPVRGGYDPQAYRAEREWASAADGTQIPLTVIRRADLSPDNGPHPSIVYGYGSYEISMDPGFSISRLSLLDRGVVYVIAHVRGGGELGRGWYVEGKKLAKINSFTDFVDSTRYLIDAGWADRSRIGAMGGSAGGLLMGAVANLAPELYAVIVAQVPFVDALTSILDPDLPLSALEWEEWGNPITDPAVYAAMKAYTPYENIREVDYPRIAAVTSLDDTRVLFVEPAKWVQRLREVSTGTELIVFKIEMDGGHGGGSGRYKGWEEVAWDYAFLLDGIGITE